MASKKYSGQVVQKKFPKTLSVAVKFTKTHPLYRKQYRLMKHFLVHDPDDTHVEGDHVTIQESRPISKQKRWITSREKPSV